MIKQFLTWLRQERLAVLVIGLIGATFIAIHYSISDSGFVAGKVAGLLCVLAFFPYIIAIIRGEIRPNRVSWWIWSALSALIAASYHSAGASNTLIVALIDVPCVLIIAILSIRYGERGKNPFNGYCVAGAIMGIGMWALSGSPSVTLSFLLFSDLMASMPTIWNSYKRPCQEDIFAWLMTLAGNILNLFAIERWVFSIAVYPVFQCLIVGIICVGLFRKFNPHFSINTSRFAKAWSIIISGFCQYEVSATVSDFNAVPYGPGLNEISQLAEISFQNNFNWLYTQKSRLIKS